MFSARVLAVVVISTTGPVWAESFPPGQMRDVVASACTQCHSGDVVTSQQKSRGEWADTVGQMVANGAVIPQANYDKVVDYLAANFPSAIAKVPAAASKAVAVLKASPGAGATTKPSSKRTQSVKSRVKRIPPK